MIENCAAYLKSIGMKDEFCKRAIEAVEFYEELFPEKATDIFVSEYANSDGTRFYDALWLFSDELVYEAKEFLVKDDFDATPLSGQVCYWNVIKDKYNFKKATAESRLTVKLQFKVNLLSGELKASGEHCDHLKNVFVKHVIGNFVRTT